MTRVLAVTAIAAAAWAALNAVTYVAVLHWAAELDDNEIQHLRSIHP